MSGRARGFRRDLGGRLGASAPSGHELRQVAVTLDATVAGLGA